MELLLLLLCAGIPFSQQVPSDDSCACELRASETAFPQEKLSAAENDAAECNSQITPQKVQELESLLLGLDLRLPQLQEDVSLLEKEDDGDLYGVISLQVIENELRQINQIIDTLNGTTLGHRELTTHMSTKLEDLKTDLQKLETYDSMHVVKTQQANQRLRRDLDQCRTGLVPTPEPTQPPGNCALGHFLNITGPSTYTAGEYPGSYKYGAWGRDPQPEAGKENWYWLVMMTSGNKFSNYVRRYSGLSALIVGLSTPGNVQIHSSNPTTNTIQGPNVVLYGEALYYNCYNQDAVCRFNLTAKTVTKVQLPQGTRFNSKGNFCHLDECYPYTDLDLATDESGVWVVYTTNQDFGNLVLSKVEQGAPPVISQTWKTSVFKQGVTNTFMACGVLYATRYVDKQLEEIFYSLDTVTGKETFNIGIFFKKPAPNVLSLNYSPVDQMLHAYCDSWMVSYHVVFG